MAKTKKDETAEDVASTPAQPEKTAGDASFEATAAATKSELDKQPKVRMFVPLEGGEPVGTILPVNINGHRYNVPKGTPVDVPQTVAEVIADSLRLPVSSLDLSSASKDRKDALDA